MLNLFHPPNNPRTCLKDLVSNVYGDTADNDPQ